MLMASKKSMVRRIAPSRQSDFNGMRSEVNAVTMNAAADDRLVTSRILAERHQVCAIRLRMLPSTKLTEEAWRQVSLNMKKL